MNQTETSIGCRAPYPSTIDCPHRPLPFLRNLSPITSHPSGCIATAARCKTCLGHSPNLAEQSILASRFGEAGISPLYLFLGALVPTLINGVTFMCFVKRATRGGDPLVVDRAENGSDRAGKKGRASRHLARDTAKFPFQMILPFQANGPAKE